MSCQRVSRAASTTATSGESHNGNLLIRLADLFRIEALGAEVILIAALGPQATIEISARLGRDFQAAIGGAQRLYLDLMEMQLFDPETTYAIPRRT